MINYIDKLRIAATVMVFSLHSLLFTGKNFPMQDILGENGGYFIFFTPAWGAVWIFFVMSGYLAGIGFCKNKYELSIQGIKKYYWKKVKRIYIPTILYIAFCTVMIKPDFLSDNDVILKIITCTYAGTPGFNGPGATWFVFTLMWLYFISPLIAWVLTKIPAKQIVLFFVFILLLGIANRLNWYINEWAWVDLYTYALCNLDLFTCGFFVAYMEDKNKIQQNNYFRYGLVGLFIFFIMVNNYMIAYEKYIAVYQYIFPSLYLIFACLYLYCFRVNFSICRNSEIKNTFIKKIAKRFATISFEFYLFHSMIFDRLAKHIGGHTASEQYLKFFMVSFVITYIFSVGWHKAFKES